MAVRRPTRLALLAATTAAVVAAATILPAVLAAPSPTAAASGVAAVRASPSRPPSTATSDDANGASAPTVSTCATRGGHYAARNGRLAVAPAWEAAAASSPGWVQSPAPQSASFPITAPALTWQPTASITSPTLEPGSQGVLRLPFSVDVAGHYRVLLHSVSAGITDANDVWFSLNWPRRRSAFVRDRGNVDDRSLSPVSTVATGGYVKMYQNVGAGRWTWESNTVDENDHYLITRWLVPGRVYIARLAARSAVYSVDRLVLYVCDKKLEGEGGCDDSTGTWQQAVESKDSVCMGADGGDKEA
ncbi:hypothetical protein MMPV_006384 [Pyropia vietnamensis]